MEHMGRTGSTGSKAMERMGAAGAPAWFALSSTRDFAGHPR